MKQVELIHFESCPYCKQARRWLQEVTAQHPELAAVHVEQIDEKLQPERVKGRKYWYVPTFYVDGKKVHEGVASRQIVEDVLRSALY